MYMKLHEVAKVFSGYTFRGAVKPDTKGHICVFQAKDLVQGAPVADTANLTRISDDVPGYDGHLRRNDVVLVARGMKAGAFRATVFTATDDNVIASSSVHVIRIIGQNILPEFLSLYLNSKEGQDALSSIVTGSYIGAIPRRELEKIKIPIPPLSKQEALIHLFRNMRDQKKILDRKNEITQNIINATFKSLVTT
jgi:type I restriction enzyme, S subunit